MSQSFQFYCTHFVSACRTIISRVFNLPPVMKPNSIYKYL